MKGFLALSALIILALSAVLYTPIPPGYGGDDRAKVLFETAMLKIRYIATELILKYKGSDAYVATQRYMDNFRGPWEASNLSDPDVEVKKFRVDTVPVEVYSPVGVSGLKPALVFLHGGGFISYSNSYQTLMQELVKRTGTVGVIIHYTLAPDNVFPQPILDCELVFQYLQRKAGRLDIDPQRISLIGDSAGGNLAAVMATRITQNSIDAEIYPQFKSLILVYPFLQFIDMYLPSGQDMMIYGMDAAETKARIACLYLGMPLDHVPYMLNGSHVHPDILKSRKMRLLDRSLVPDRLIKTKTVKARRGEMERYHQRNEGMRNAQNDFLPFLINEDVAPMFAERVGIIPRTLILTCGFDSIRDDGYLYYRYLKDRGTKVTFKNYENGYHGIMQRFNTMAVGKQMMDDVVFFVNKYK